jgi:hypothetical protein
MSDEVAEAKAELAAAAEQASKHTKKESKKFKAAIYAGILVAASYVVGASGQELGLFGFSVNARLNVVHPGSQAIATPLCEEAAKSVGSHAVSTQLMPGLVTSRYDSDTLVCTFEGGQTMPFMLIYDKSGHFLQYL